MTEANEQLVRRFFQEVWNEHNLDAIDELYADDFTLHAMWQNPAAGGSGDKSGKETAKSIISNWFVIEDLDMRIEDIFSEGDTVVARLDGIGSHHADVLGIPATGKPIALEGITITKVRDGKITDTWTCWDILGLLMKLGVIPEPPPRDEFVDDGAHNPGGFTFTDGKALVREFYDVVWSKGEMDRAFDYAAPVVIDHTVVQGSSPKELPSRIRAACPDLQMHIDDQAEEGDRVMTLWRATGTHTGTDLFGIPTTNMPVDVGGITINRIENGKIVEVWDQWDRMGMLQQLGILPPPPAP